MQYIEVNVMYVISTHYLSQCLTTSTSLISYFWIEKLKISNYNSYFETVDCAS